MARLTRAVQKIFGSTAGASDIAQIGSLRNGEIVYTTDPVTLQGLSLYLTGLKGIVSSDKYIPALEDINGIYFLFSRQLAYLMQEGIAEWDASTEYHIGSKAKAPGTGNVYTSLTNNNTGNEVTDTEHWTDATITDTISKKTTAGVTVEGVKIKDEEINGNKIIVSDLQLTGSTADGFAATPTAIYNMDATDADAPDAAYTGTKVGAYDLTVKAESLASGADALGNAKYCQFAGSGYLISTNAVFDFSGTFALGFKMFFPDWTPASAVTIISNADAANAGCRLDLSTAGVLTWYENGVAICSVNVSGFDATKFYGGEIWRDAANVYILIDGVIVASGARGTITQKAVFQISGYNGATQLMPAGSRVDEVFVDFVNTHTADTLRNIYARSAKKFAVKSQDGSVTVDNGKSMNMDLIAEKNAGHGVRVDKCLFKDGDVQIPGDVDIWGGVVVNRNPVTITSYNGVVQTTVLGITVTPYVSANTWDFTIPAPGPNNSDTAIYMIYGEMAGDNTNASTYVWIISVYSTTGITVTTLHASNPGGANAISITRNSETTIRFSTNAYGNIKRFGGFKLA